jgi:hypothetical protein
MVQLPVVSNVPEDTQCSGKRTYSASQKTTAIMLLAFVTNPSRLDLDR